jgi:tripartite-type tricarboxylate transporter receptor subunit TctC
VPPGGSTDALARLMTLRMQAIPGQPVIVDNQPVAEASLQRGRPIPIRC